jgi:hypothetical protein
MNKHFFITTPIPEAAAQHASNDSELNPPDAIERDNQNQEVLRLQGIRMGEKKGARRSEPFC